MAVWISRAWLVQSGSIFGAGLDVTDPDPADPDNPLLDMENVTVLPHMACAPPHSFEALRLHALLSALLLFVMHRTPCLLRSFGGSDNTAALCPLPLLFCSSALRAAAPC